MIDQLPRGWNLSDDSWQTRHRGILVVLWVHVAVVPIYGTIQGVGIRHVFLEAAGIALLGLGASSQLLNRRARTISASIGLLTASGVLVHLSSGSIEMHFHFFVMVPLVALYQDWITFLVAIGYVVVHHGFVGTVDPKSVFNHPAGYNQPWKWAAIHAFFITGISIVCLVTWRLLETALERSKAEARVKSEFLSVLSHEIRTPLTAVIGYTGLLADSDLSAEQRDYANTIKRSSDHLLTLINDILDFSKLEAGRLELDEAPFDVLNLVDETVGLVAETAHQRGLVLSSICENSVPRTVTGDSGRIAQVLLNLLSNAVKFTHDGEISVRVTGRPIGESAHKLTVSVRDSGIGIDPETIDTLFGSFTQAEASTSRKYGGTGLGLAIAKQLAELMGGTISVDSTVGVGSTFEASFIVREGTPEKRRYEPASMGSDSRVLIVGSSNAVLTEYLEQWGITPCTVTPADAIARARAGQRADVIFVTATGDDPSAFALTLRAAHQPRVVHLALVMAWGQDRPVDGMYDTVLTDPLRQSDVYDALVTAGAEAAPQPEPVGARSGPTARSPMQLLVAEDNHVNQKVLVSQLRRLGYDADVVANGLEAVQATAVRHYDVVLMDLHMPEMDGITAARLIRERPDPPAIIGVTADATTEARAACRAAGMRGYVTKPIDSAVLASALRSVA